MSSISSSSQQPSFTIPIVAFDNFHLIERRVNETSIQQISRAFQMCIKSYLKNDDPRSRGIVVVRGAFDPKELPTEKFISDELKKLFALQKRNKKKHRFILDEISRVRSIYDTSKNKSYRELNEVFVPMQDISIKIIEAAIEIFNGTSYCKNKKFVFDFRRNSSGSIIQELISSLGCEKAEAVKVQDCHIDFPAPQYNAMSCFLSASDGTHLQLLFRSSTEISESSSLSIKRKY